MDRENKRRELRYVVTPKAMKDYDADQTAQLTFNISATEVRFNVTDSSNFAVGDRVVIDSEIMKVQEKPDATTLVVKRGFDSSIPAQHTATTFINLLTTADDAAIVPGDDFGFNEFESFFDDGKSYSPTKQSDV